MDGYAYLSGLPPASLTADPRVPLWWSGWGEFRALAPASYGGAFYVGPEVTLGRSLADAGVSVALVKHAVGGTDLANYWYPGTTPGGADAGAGFATLADTIEGAARALDATGEPWQWAGFAWMQGESDALDRAMAAAYEANLTYLVASIRTLTGEPRLPVAVGLIASDEIWTHAAIVRAAQRAVADADDDVVFVETDDLPQNELDVAHYDGPSNRVLGERFARAFLTAADVEAGPDAPTAALTVTSGRLDYDFTGTCGWAFTLDAPILVTDVGGWGSTYLWTSGEVGLWDEDANLVLRGDLPSWLDAPTSPRGGFWYAAVDPTPLDAGTYRVGLVSWEGDSDRYMNDVSASFAPGITYAGGVYAAGYWLLYPSNNAGTSEVNFVGPSFLYTPL